MVKHPVSVEIFDHVWPSCRADLLLFMLRSYTSDDSEVVGRTSENTGAGTSGGR